MEARAIAHEDPRDLDGPVFARRLELKSRLAPPSSRRTAPAVTHAHAALAFHLSGTLRVAQRGDWKLTSGDVFLIPAGEPHRMLETHGVEAWGLGFCVPCFQASNEREPSDESRSWFAPFERVRDGASPVVSIPAARQAFLQTLFSELEQACARARGAQADVGALAAQRSLLTLVFDEIRRAELAASPVASSVHSAAPSLVVECLRLIERRCLGPLSLEELAAAVHRTPSHVTTALRRATGRSAHAWIVAGRMAEARRRLLHSDELVEVIAERVGYQDATHFIRMFRREHGVTPAAWRARKFRSRASERASTLSRAPSPARS
jgi:AraC family transcriptional activator of pobA